MTTDSIVFVWRGTDRNGQPSAGEEMASSAAMARAQLRRPVSYTHLTLPTILLV